MVMTSTEQNTLNQALNTNKTATQVVIPGDGSNQYVLVRLVPIQILTPTDLTAFATRYSVTVASP